VTQGASGLQKTSATYHQRFSVEQVKEEMMRAM